MAHPESIESAAKLEPVAGSVACLLPATLVEYLDLADWTGRIARSDKRGSIAGSEPPVLHKLGLAAHEWHAQAICIEQRYWRAIGAVDTLI